MGKAVWRMNCPTHMQWCAKEGGKSRKQSERKLETDWENERDQAIASGDLGPYWKLADLF